MNQVIKKEEAGALATNMFEADANHGIENMSQEDLALPFLKVLGQLSPEVNKAHAKYKVGAEPGMIYNNITNEIFDGKAGIKVVVCYYKRNFPEKKMFPTDMVSLSIFWYESRCQRRAWRRGKFPCLAVQILCTDLCRGLIPLGFLRHKAPSLR